ncbi:MAG: iron-containing alcohol dehydrogenase, partial [Candidatus Sumerlaeota bacterium]|nr:iron-containing alcohol dehydrogenase [Candidatus Sumerlaeota bacterium]
GFAGVLGGMFPASHGVVCARLLPYVIQANVRALETRAPDSPALARYDEVARLLTGRPAARAADSVEWAAALCSALRIPPLSEFGLKKSDFAEVVAKSQKASSMKGNPIALTDEELAHILGCAM